MVRASYKHAVQWIAVNDNGDENKLNIEELCKKTSVVLIADIFHQPINKVAIDVIKFTLQQEQVKVAYQASLDKKEKLKVDFSQNKKAR